MWIYYFERVITVIRKLEWSQRNVLAYEASGKMTEEENERTLGEIKTAIKEHGKVNIFVMLPEMARPEAGAVDDRLRFVKEHTKDIERYAIVGDQKKIKVISSIADKLIGIDIRYFSFDEENKAKEWVLEKLK
jgi:hypothetical protein